MKIDKNNNGKRKEANARILLQPGKGNIIVNNVKLEEFTQNNVRLIQLIKLPLSVLEIEEKYDIIIEAKGGGILGQVDAIKLGIAKKIHSLSTTESQEIIKKKHLLTCNSKHKERRKYGLKKARKSPQFSKR